MAIKRAHIQQKAEQSGLLAVWALQLLLLLGTEGNSPVPLCRLTEAAQPSAQIPCGDRLRHLVTSLIKYLYWPFLGFS